LKDLRASFTHKKWRKDGVENELTVEGSYLLDAVKGDHCVPNPFSFSFFFFSSFVLASGSLDF